MESKFLTNVLGRKLESIGITNRDELVVHINDFCNQEDVDGKKKTTFSD